MKNYNYNENYVNPVGKKDKNNDCFAKDKSKLVAEEPKSYGYYSKVLQRPFDTLLELSDAEAKYAAEQHAKEEKVATKKADAKKVEDAFKALNTARKDYKESLIAITEKYSADLRKLKESFEADKQQVHDVLSAAETGYATALKEFTDKYPEGYHLTLKDGDFETTISSQTSQSASDPFDAFPNLTNLFKFIFG